MKNITLTAGLVLFSLLITPTGPAHATEQKPVDKAALFIDLDGDGINDNLPDTNSDGIPDIAGTGTHATEARVQSALGDVFNTSNPANDSRMEKLKSCCDRYAEARFKVRGISLHRIGLTGTDPFGSGTGVGNAGAGACAGGVCH